MVRAAVSEIVASRAASLITSLNHSARCPWPAANGADGAVRGRRPAGDGVRAHEPADRLPNPGACRRVTPTPTCVVKSGSPRRAGRLVGRASRTHATSARNRRCNFVALHKRTRRRLRTPDGADAIVRPAASRDDRRDSDVAIAMARCAASREVKAIARAVNAGGARTAIRRVARLLRPESSHACQ